MWRSPYQAPPQPQSLTLDTLSKRLAVPTLLLPAQPAAQYLPQFYPAWIQPPQPQSPAAALSKLAVATPLAPPFGATVLGRVEQFYPPWVQPPAIQDRSLSDISIRQAVPTLIVSAPLGVVPPAVWVQPPPVQGSLAALTFVNTATTQSPPFAFTPFGSVPPVPWQPPPPVQGALAALSKTAVVTPFSPPFAFQAFGNVPPTPWIQPPKPQQPPSWGNATPTPTPTPPADSGYLGGMPAGGGKKKRHPMDWPPRYIIEAKAQQEEFGKIAAPLPLPMPDPLIARRQRDMDALVAILAVLDD